MLLPDRDMTDWQRVQREYDSDAPIPYDPNDEAATEAFIKQATILAAWPNPVIVQKDGVPVNAVESTLSEATEPRAKAS